METVAVWMLAGIFVFGNGEVSVMNEEQIFKTEAACLAKKKEAEVLIDTIPTDKLLGYGHNCYKVEVVRRQPDLGKGKKTSL